MKKLFQKIVKFLNKNSKNQKKEAINHEPETTVSCFGIPVTQEFVKQTKTNMQSFRGYSYYENLLNPDSYEEYKIIKIDKLLQNNQNLRFVKFLLQLKKRKINRIVVDKNLKVYLFIKKQLVSTNYTLLPLIAKTEGLVFNKTIKAL